MQYTLTATTVYHHARFLLQDALGLTDFSPACPARTLLAVVFAATARLTSLFAAGLRLAGAPAAETLRKALLASLPTLGELEDRSNDALAAHLPRRLRRRQQRLALDLTLVPYHGRYYLDPKEIVRGQAKSGTTHFHAYATVYLIFRGQRFTIALTVVHDGDPLKEVIRRLLRRAAAAGVRPALLLLDREFYSVDVIRYLQAARYPFLMPLVCRGRKADHPQGPSGSRVYKYWRRSGWDTYTLREAGGRTATVSVGVHVRNRRGRRGKHGREQRVYGYWGLQPKSVAWLSETYRQRFGIESSYRQLREAKAKTCSRSPVVRLFLVAVALVLRNVWVWLHYALLSTPRRGGRQLNAGRLRFKALLLMLLHEAERWLGVTDDVIIERSVWEAFASE
jgi:Transposase DDE domain